MKVWPRLPDGPDAEHRRPHGVSVETVSAVGKVSEALEFLERARGPLYSFHQLMGGADLTLGAAVQELREAGHPEQADRLATELIGRNVLAGRWTFQVVEEFDDGYWTAFRDHERRVRDELGQATEVCFVRAGCGGFGCVGDELRGDGVEFDVLLLGESGDEGEGVVGVDVEAFHHDAFGLADDVPTRQRGAQLVFLLCSGEGDRVVGGEDQADRLGFFGERTGRRSVEVQRPEIIALDEQLEAEHGTHPRLDGGGREAEPAGFGGHVGDVHGLLLPHRVQARPVVQLGLQLIEATADGSVAAWACTTWRRITRLMTA